MCCKQNLGQNGQFVTKKDISTCACGPACVCGASGAFYFCCCCCHQQQWLRYCIILLDWTLTYLPTFLSTYLSA
uniref:Uncharacterized protein n=1 Tax=Octopus bimaculoides TaxID=37653 RepID=A0A0L8HNI2_OCTBM